MADTPPPPSRRDARKQAEIGLAEAKAEKPLWKKWWVILGSILVIAAIAAAAFLAGGDDTATPAADTTTDTSDDPAEAGDGSGFGSPAADDEFTFTVNSFECGEDTAGEDPFEVEAEGEYCIAEVTVENTGDDSQVMNIPSQYLYIGEERHSPDPDAIFADERAEAIFINEIDSGSSVDGIVVWDVPEGSEPDRLELHHSPFSDGVEINLR